MQKCQVILRCGWECTRLGIFSVKGGLKLSTGPRLQGIVKSYYSSIDIVIQICYRYIVYHVVQHFCTSNVLLYHICLWCPSLPLHPYRVTCCEWFVNIVYSSIDIIILFVYFKGVRWEGAVLIRVIREDILLPPSLIFYQSAMRLSIG